MNECAELLKWRKFPGTFSKLHPLLLFSCKSRITEQLYLNHGFSCAQDKEI